MIAGNDGCLWEKVERPTNSRMARVCMNALCVIEG
jgi:hypothetical protein